MDFNLYDMVYLITNVFNAYTIYKFMKIFYKNNRTTKAVEYGSYIIYYIVISAIYLNFKIPVVQLMVTIIAFLLLSLNYEASMKKRVLATLCIYLILMCIELIVVVLTGFIQFPIYSSALYSSVFGLIMMRILAYIIVLLTNNFQSIKEGTKISTLNWLCIIIIPLSSLYFIMTLLSLKGITSKQLIICIFLLLFTNFATFYLYNMISIALKGQTEKLLLEQQYKSYQQQFDIMKTSLRSTNATTHDMKNHFFSIMSLLENKEVDEAYQYIERILNSFVKDKAYVYTDNNILDSILNFKFQEARQYDIVVNSKISVPEQLSVNSFDMTIILGNLLDNAINALKKEESEKILNVRIKYNKGRLLIIVENTFSGNVKYENGVIVTTHKDKFKHGIGLQNIKAALVNYDGKMDIKVENRQFKVDIIMYIPL